MPRYHLDIQPVLMGMDKTQKAALDRAIPTTGRYMEAEDVFEAMGQFVSMLRARAEEWEDMQNPLSKLAVDMYGLGLMVSKASDS